jgi:hypothetical protein
MYFLNYILNANRALYQTTTVQSLLALHSRFLLNKFHKINVYYDGIHVHSIKKIFFLGLRGTNIL